MSRSRGKPQHLPRLQTTVVTNQAISRTLDLGKALGALVACHLLLLGTVQALRMSTHPHHRMCRRRRLTEQLHLSVPHRMLPRRSMIAVVGPLRLLIRQHLRRSISPHLGIHLRVHATLRLLHHSHPRRLAIVRSLHPSVLHHHATHQRVRHSARRRHVTHPLLPHTCHLRHRSTHQHLLPLPHPPNILQPHPHIPLLLLPIRLPHRHIVRRLRNGRLLARRSNRTAVKTAATRTARPLLGTNSPLVI